MLTNNPKRSINAGIYLVLLAFIFVAVFGLSHSMLPVDSSQMSKCPFMVSKVTICSMGVTEHIAQWQQLFNSLPYQNVMLVLLVLVGVILLVSLFKNVSNLQAEWIKARKKNQHENPETNLFNYLKIVFADGILQPKLYA